MHKITVQRNATVHQKFTKQQASSTGRLMQMQLMKRKVGRVCRLFGRLYLKANKETDYVIVQLL